MGRKAKYITEKDKKDANGRNCRNYYIKNAERIKKRRMERYWEIKDERDSIE